MSTVTSSGRAASRGSATRLAQGSGDHSLADVSAGPPRAVRPGGTAVAQERGTESRRKDAGVTGAGTPPSAAGTPPSQPQGRQVLLDLAAMTLAAGHGGSARQHEDEIPAQRPVHLLDVVMLTRQERLMRSIGCAPSASSAWLKVLRA